MQEWEYTRIGTWRINAVHANGEFGHVPPLRNSRDLTTSPTTRQASLPAVHGVRGDSNLVQPVAGSRSRSGAGQVVCSDPFQGFGRLDFPKEHGLS